MGKKILSFLMALVLMFFVLATISEAFLQKVFFNELTYVNEIKASGTYDKIYTSINEDLQYMLLSNNIPVDTLKNIITIDEVKSLVQDSIFNISGFVFKGGKKPEAIDYKVFTDRFDERINAFIANNKIEKTEELTKTMEDLKKTTTSIIKSKIEFINVDKVSKSSSVVKLVKLFNIVGSPWLLTILFVIDGVFIALFMVLWRHRINRAFAWSGYSVLSAGLLTFLLFFSGYLSKFYKNVPLSTLYLKTMVGQVIKKYLITLTFMGVFCMILGIAMISVRWIHIYKMTNKHSSVEAAN